MKMMTKSDLTAVRLHKICDICICLGQAGTGIGDLLGTRLLRLRLKHLRNVEQ